MPFVAAFAPTAGAAAATAFAVGLDDHDAAHHAHLHDHTAFLSLPSWAPAKAQMVWDKLFGHEATAAAAAAPTSDQGRMVEYYASGCHHCKDLAPIWKDASSQWAQESNPDANKVVWEQKQCLDENWQPGPDFKECEAQGIQGFPSVKFFPAGAKQGHDFFMERTAAKLQEFVKTGIHPDPNIMPHTDTDTADVKLVDFYAAACPHCKHLEPVWADAQKQWDAAVKEGEALDHNPGEQPNEQMPVVEFVKKQCYDDHWKPGPDFEECKGFGVQGFPTVKLFVPDEHGHGYRGMDYTGPRTGEAIAKFIKHETGLDDFIKEKTAALAADTKAAAAAQMDSVQKAQAAGAPVSDELKKKVIEDAAQAQKLAGGSVPETPQALKQAVQTATMPLPVLACLPVRMGRKSPSSKRAKAEAPAGATAFI